MQICFLQNYLFQNSFSNTIRVSKSWNPDQAIYFVRPDLDPNCLQRLSEVDTGKLRVQVKVAF